MITAQVEKEVTVFRNTKGFVLVREIHLAFGNKVKEIHYTKHIEHATQFTSDTLKLDPSKFYHPFRTVLELEIKMMERCRVSVTTKYEIIGE